MTTVARTQGRIIGTDGTDCIPDYFVYTQTFRRVGHNYDANTGTRELTLLSANLVWPRTWHKTEAYNVKLIQRWTIDRDNVDPHFCALLESLNNNFIPNSTSTK